MDKVDIVLAVALVGCVLTGAWIYQENYSSIGKVYQCSESNKSYPQDIRELCKRLGK
jgi:hypothetical protein